MTTHPLSTLNLLTQSPFLRISHILSPTRPTQMTTRTAEEAELSQEEFDRDTNRQRTERDDPNLNPAPSISPPADSLDILEYIPIPAIDPIHIHGWDTHSTTDNLSTFQINSWKRETGAKLLAYKAYGGRMAERDEITKLRNLIVSTLNLNANPIIAPPTPETNEGRRDPNPVCSLIKGILPEKAQELITRVRYRSTRHSPPPETNKPPEIHIHRGPHGVLYTLQPTSFPIRHNPKGLHVPRRNR
jgi:hypothetical protein